MKLEDVILRGLRSGQPLATDVPAGAIYCVTDESLVERSNGSAWELFSGGGGGSSLLKSATVTLDDGQIRGLPTTSIDIVITPGSGKYIKPLEAILFRNFSVAYTGIDADTNYPAIRLSCDKFTQQLIDFVDEPDTPQAGLTYLLGIIGISSLAIGQVRVIKLTASPSGQAIDFPRDEQASASENLPFKIWAFNSIDFTGGDPANTLKILVFYIEADVS